MLEELEGGRDTSGIGDVGRADVGVGKTADIGVRDFIREDAVGIVNLRAAEFEEGVVGRTGAIPNSSACARLAELCAFAREDAVGALYRAVFGRVPDAEG